MRFSVAFAAALSATLIFAADSSQNIETARGDKLECDPNLFQIINSVEGHPKKPSEYPYIVSFNSKSDATSVKKIINTGWLDSRTFDCNNLERCAAFAQTLTDFGITNLDLGAYQINYAYHKYPHSDYFDNEAAEKHVCEILYNLSEKYGWSWETIARYHSSARKHNRRYQARLIANYERANGATKEQ